jgi:hypothetical protein
LLFSIAGQKYGKRGEMWCSDVRWQMADGRWQMADGRWQMAEIEGIEVSKI